ncbi:EAL domain-containing protein [Kordiimonas lipolytica]|uniref:EAL domain-containing protein n=1 Tax=Kordiimonas lipolytica TaxID=1662421 RepID=A0ABV8U924_9PROT|nr:EAL domain-containing protein [Kordiimonas lipolytica]
MDCKECETIHAHIFEKTFFWIYVPTSKAADRLKEIARHRGLEGEAFDQTSYRIVMGRADVGAFLTTLFGEFNGQELANTKIVTTKDETLSPSDMGRVFQADVFINRFQSQWIIESLEAKRYETWFQPIFHAKQPDQAFGQEGLFRLRDAEGTIIPPGHVFDVASKSDLLFTADLLARKSAVEAAAAGRLKGKIFINFNPSSIYDPAYCLRATAAAIEAAGLKPRDVVFELTETHQARDKAHLKGILAFYRSAGFGVALDDIGSGWSGLNMLHEMRPDYVKLDMDLVRDVHEDVFKQTIVKRLLQIAKDNGIKTIAEGIECAEEAQCLTKMGADYLQGYYFAKPAPVLPADENPLAEAS